MERLMLWAAVGGLLVAGAAVVVVHDVRRDRPVVVSEAACAAGWDGPKLGHQVVPLHNTSPDAAQVYLIDPDGNLAYAEARDVTPGSTRDLSTTLGTGHYALRCVFSNGTVLTSAAHDLHGTVAGAIVGVPPMPSLDLEPATHAYRAYVNAGLPPLRAAVGLLAADIDAGDLDRARTDWLPAHLAYERLGAAYNSFGDFDGSMNGDTEGLAGGVHDASWTGFFRIEYGLWHGDSVTALKPLADGLRNDVSGLIKDFPSEDVDPFDLPLRAHEILENALQFQVSGADDYGSGTSLATVYANTEGTLDVIATLRPLIQTRQADLLRTIDRGIATVQADLTADRDGNTWIAADQLSHTRRQKLDADLGALLEQLAVIPDLLAERTSA